MDLKERILVALGLNKEVALAVQEQLVDGTIIVSEADMLEVGVSDLSVLSEDGTTVLLAPGSYELENGTTLVVEPEGVIAEIEEAEEVEEEVEEEAPTEEEVEEEVEEVEASENIVESPQPKKIKEIKEYEFSKEEIITEITNVVSELLSEAQKDVEAIRAELSEMKGYQSTMEEENVSLANEVAKLSAEPATTPESLNKFSKEVSKELTIAERKRMTTKERLVYNLSKINK
tara:strand:+ start:7768 stop:8463 length:696 start_codon:yes stop_codon:yes gene_type:complete